MIPVECAIPIWLAIGGGIAFAWYRFAKKLKRPRGGTWRQMGVGNAVRGTGMVSGMEGGSLPPDAQLDYGPAIRLPEAYVLCDPDWRRN